MSSFLKHVDPETGKLVEDAHHDSNADDALPSIGDVRARIDHVINAELQRLDDAYAVALKAMEERARIAEDSLAHIQKEHDELVSRHAEQERKLAILHELKEKLNGF